MSRGGDLGNLGFGTLIGRSAEYIGLFNGIYIFKTRGVHSKVCYSCIVILSITINSYLYVSRIYILEVVSSNDVVVPLLFESKIFLYVDPSFETEIIKLTFL